jgi:hypothetical protein
MIDYLQLMQGLRSGNSWAGETPHPGGQRHQPHDEDHGKGAERAGAVSLTS